MWSGYSVDKHGSYCAGGSLILWTQDPKNRPFWRVPGRFEKKELEDHLVELFPEGLSPHGWRFMLDRYDYIRDPITNDAFVNPLGQSRPGGLPGCRTARHHATRRASAVIRRRHPLLRWRPTGPH